MLPPEHETTWDQQVAATRQAIAVWRTAHPDATLKDIEQEVDRQLAAMRAGLNCGDGDDGTRGGTAPALSGVWWTHAVGGRPHPPLDHHPQRGDRVDAPLRPLPGVWHRAFPPWMRRWGCCLAT